MKVGLTAALDKEGSFVSGVQGSNLIRRKKHRHYGVKEKKNTHRRFNNPPSPILKEKREGAPSGIFIGLGNGLWVEWRG